MTRSTDCSFEKFAKDLRGGDVLEKLRRGLIGEGATFKGPFGQQSLIYADYVASGRALRQIENFVVEQILPFYANSHSEASYCGWFITQMRERAREIIAEQCGSNEDYATIFSGSGATSGINRLVHLLGVSDAVADGKKPLILIGPYEHHSNILPWRESGAEVIEIGEAQDGGP
ncbi:MAG: aminotransferase class V-fold PLP-dependent enzyme, partial [Rhizobiaceae bacterium]